jgi:four helix bundle protein
MDLAASIYTLTRPLRQQKHADLASQLQRAAVSIPANIAEGKGRGSAAEFARFLTIALGSLREVETLLQVADGLGVIQKETFLDLQKQADEVGKVLFGLEKATRRRRSDGQRPKPRAES